MKTTTYNSVSILCFFMVFGCLEEIPLETKVEFNEALVIEATITDKLKPQIIKLSKSFRLESNDPMPASNASVTVTDDIGNTYNFSEAENGLYHSDIAFAAQPNVNYKLEVIDNGILYNSNQVSFLGSTQIDDLYIERGFNENNQEGISIFVDTFDPNDTSKYYRYVYEETYKIIAPKYSPLKLNILNDELPIPASQFSSIQEIQDHFVELVTREEQVRICYNTENSNTIIITDTNNFAEDRLEKYRVRFISSENAIMSHRYSILVKQYIQSPEAYNFYKILKSFSLSEGLFSENQLGFLEGNISSNSESSENKVIGFFEVSPSDSKRVFFNYSDEFPESDLPPYFEPCNDLIPALFKIDPLSGDIVESDVLDAINNNLQYAGENPGNNPMFIGPVYPFLMVIEPCGDCTALGTTDIPDFWEE